MRATGFALGLSSGRDKSGIKPRRLPCRGGHTGRHTWHEGV